MSTANYSCFDVTRIGSYLPIMNANARIMVVNDMNNSKGSILKKIRTTENKMMLKVTLKMASTPLSIFELAAIVAPVKLRSQNKTVSAIHGNRDPFSCTARDTY
jgi:hypothetical protein